MAKKKPSKRQLQEAVAKYIYSRETSIEDLVDAITLFSTELGKRQRNEERDRRYDPRRKCDNYDCEANRMWGCISDKIDPMKCPKKVGYWRCEPDKLIARRENNARTSSK